MFDVYCNQEQELFVWKQLAQFNFGNRSYGNGGLPEQAIGILAQTIVSDMLQVERPNGKSGFDGGVDINVRGVTIDVKCMGRKTYMKNTYVHNLMACQDYDVEYYLFCSFNTTNKCLTICGLLPKILLHTIGTKFEKGSIRQRTDGTKFQIKNDLWEIPQNALIQINSVSDLLREIGKE